MCKEVILHPIYELHLDKSKKQCLRPFVDQYNEGKPLGERLRSSHLKLAEFLLHLYYARLWNAQRSGKLVLGPKRPLPTLRTSNGALAKEMGLSKRTIINLRERLSRAGIIAYAAWHGSNSGYELHLNPLVMHLKTQFSHSNYNALFFCVDLQTLRHIETGNLLQDTNKLLNTSGATASTGTDNQSVVQIRTVENSQKPWKSPVKPVESAATSSAQVNQGTGYETAENPLPPNGPEPSPPSCAAPPRREPAESLPVDMDEAVGHLSTPDRNKVERIARSVWAYAHATLYSDKFLTHSVKWKAQVAIAEYIAWWVKPGGYDKAKLVLIRRIDIARRFLDNDPLLKEQKLGDLESKKNSRWIPLPHLYFDMRNTRNGFHKTQKWYNQRQQQIAAAKRKEALTKATNQYENSLLPGAPYGPDQAYQVLTQKLRKKYGAGIIREFQERIAQLQAA